MQLLFKTRKLEKQLTQPVELQKAYGKHSKKISQRIADLKAADNLGIIGQIPGAGLHRLSGERKNEYAVNVSANYRLIFEPDYPEVPQKEDGGHDLRKIKIIKLLMIQDYH